MSAINLDDLFAGMNGLHVAVIGDVMLDKYWWGEIDRISPEAPVPIVSLQQRETRLGGAANVALNCIALGAKVTLASVVGNDIDGNTLIRLCKENGIGTDAILQSNRRPTTTKTRLIARQQQLMRLDDEITDDLDTEDEHPFIDLLLRFLQREKPQVVIFEDYNKGVLKENVIQRAIAHCNEIGILTAVDPKKNNFLTYKGVTIFKPNLKEVREGLDIALPVVDLASMQAVHQALTQELHHKLTFITLSEKGVFYDDSDSAAIIPSHRRNIADVSGAGDTVIATAAMVYALTGNAAVMAEIANMAGGMVCEEVGVVPINKEQLLVEIKRFLS